MSEGARSDWAPATQVGRLYVEVEGKEMWVRIAYDARSYVKCAGGKWDASRKRWKLTASAVAMAGLEAQIPEGWVWYCDGGAVALREAARGFRGLAEVKEASALADWPSPTVSWLHQRRAYHFAKQLDGSGLFIDMGGGKSKVLIGLMEEAEARFCLILCPKSVLGVWPKQFDIHAKDKWLHWTSEGNIPVHRKVQNFFAWSQLPKSYKKVAIINYDVFWRPEFMTCLNRMANEGKIDYLACDESHKLKSPGGRASKSAATLGKKIPKVTLLTGTPMPHSPADIYAQYRVAAPDVFGTSFNRFKNKYAVMGGFENKQIIGWQNESELTRKIGSVSITIKRDEMGLDVPSALPPIRRECVLSNKATKFYVELKREFVADIEEGIVTADNALTRLMRLRQVCSGYTRTDEDRDVLVGDEKERLLADVLEDIPEGSPVVVFAAFHHDLDAIERVAKACGRTYAELSGRRRDALDADATLMEGVDVAGVQLQSGGVGVDFTRSSYAIYYSLDYNLGNKLQSMARLDRPGQQEHVIFIYLVAKLAHGAQTVDELTLRALDNRQSFVDAIMEASRRGEL